MVQLGEPEVELFCGSEEPFKGWNCPSYDHLEAAPQIEASKTGSHIVFETLIYPIKGEVDRSNLPVFEKTENGNETVYIVTFGGKTVRVKTGQIWELV